ncbi:histone-arginine methyltransferase METTL23 [Lepeophtheirus salmonis]|uniref:histone-arginine methyltransferase METTL23 n=1 Tax=Lepeophtheirus salmonis TaxID=72036 RepID=UPI001AE4480C|nr:methyltransferase-like protein 23 [Lepeophtheirus salmonis]
MSEEIPRGLLCDYPSTSSEEESVEAEDVGGSGDNLGISPRKRKSEILSVNNHLIRDSKGGIDLLGSCSSHSEWINSLEAKLSSFVPRSPSEDTQFEVDSTTWELKVVHKRRRRSEQEDEEQEPGSTSSKDPLEESKPPQPRRRKFTFKPFKKSVSGKLVHDSSRPEVSVLVPEKLQTSYGLYVWPSSHVLSWFIWTHVEDFVGKRILELGSGTSLPGLLCAKVGSTSVTLTDRGSNPDILDNIKTAVEINNLKDVVQVKELSWGLLYQNLYLFESSLDIIIGSDLFFDPKVFRDLVLTVAKLLSLNPSSVFICAVQERSPDWSIAEYLEEFGLRASYVYPKDFLSRTGLDEGDLIGGHTIYIMKLFLNSKK